MTISKSSVVLAPSSPSPPHSTASPQQQLSRTGRTLWRPTSHRLTAIDRLLCYLPLDYTIRGHSHFLAGTEEISKLYWLKFCPKYGNRWQVLYWTSLTDRNCSAAVYKIAINSYSYWTAELCSWIMNWLMQMEFLIFSSSSKFAFCV